jgi:hypothetical protein
MIDMVPTPDNIDQPPPASTPLQLIALEQGFRDANSHHIDGIFFPEASSSWYLSKILQQIAWQQLALQQLAFPQPPMINLKEYDGYVWDRARVTSAAKWRAGDRYSTLGMDCM